MNAPMFRSAQFSDCRFYRYRLDRRWADGRAMAFIMLNPSTADADKDDPTIRRCIGFSKREGCGALIVGNIYAFRATKPADLWKAAFPVGPDNHRALSEIADAADIIVCAWGDQGTGPTPDALRGHDLWCLGRTKNNYAPRHPLHVKADRPLEPWIVGPWSYRA